MSNIDTHWTLVATIRDLERRGFVVRHADDASRKLSWSRIAPFPFGLSFKDEALEQLRKQITPDLIRFQVEQSVPGSFGRPEIHRASILVL